MTAHIQQGPTVLNQDAVGYALDRAEPLPSAGPRLGTCLGLTALILSQYDSALRSRSISSGASPHQWQRRLLICNRIDYIFDPEGT